MFQWCLLHPHPVFYGTAVGEGALTSELWILCSSDPFLVPQSTAVTTGVPLLAPHTGVTTKLGWLIVSLSSPPSAVQTLWVTALPLGPREGAGDAVPIVQEDESLHIWELGESRNTNRRPQMSPQCSTAIGLFSKKNCYSFKLAYLQYKVWWSQRK